VAGFVLRCKEHERGSCDVRAALGLGPGEVVEAILDGMLHQLMPGGVEVHLVDAMAEAVVGAEDWRILVGLEAGADQRLGAQQLSEFFEARPGPGGSFAIEGAGQSRVGGEEIVILESRGLIQDFVGTGKRRNNGGIHFNVVLPSIKFIKPVG
jgi:hypothetical protein